MSVSITKIKNLVPAKLHGTTLSKLTGSFYDKCAEAAGAFLTRVRPYTVIRKYVITNAIYDHVYNYVVADDLEPDSIITIRPISDANTRERALINTTEATSMRQFDAQRAYNTMTIEYINGQKTLKLSKHLQPRTILFEMDSLDVGATVTGSGDVTDLALDYLDHVSGSASASFNLSGVTGQGKITVVLDSVIDLSSLEGQGAAFTFSKFPTASALTNIKMRIGSDASNYYESTITAAISSAFADDAWQLIMENLRTAVETGDADFEAVKWIEFEYNYTAGTVRTGVKLDNITAALGEAWEVVYYSNCMFTDVTGLTWKDTPTADNDLLLVEGTKTLNAYIYQLLLNLQPELKGKNMSADFTWYDMQLNGKSNQRGLYEQLAGVYPDQSMNRQGDYYTFGDLTGGGGGDSYDDCDGHGW